MRKPCRSSLVGLVERPRHHPPNGHVIVFRDGKRWHVLVGKGEAGFPVVLIELQAHLAANAGNNNLTMARGHAAINHHHIAVVDACFDHGVAADAPKEGGGAIGHQDAGQVDFIINEIVGGAGKARAYATAHHRQRQGHGAQGADKVESVRGRWSEHDRNITGTYVASSIMHSRIAPW